MSKSQQQRKTRAKKKASAKSLKTQIRCRIRFSEDSPAEAVSTAEIDPQIGLILRWMNDQDIDLSSVSYGGVFSIVGAIESEVPNDPNPSLALFEDIVALCLEQSIKSPGRTINIRQALPEVGKYRLQATFAKDQQNIDKQDSASHVRSSRGTTNTVTDTDFKTALDKDATILEESIKTLRKASHDGPKSFGKACDEYTDAAKSLATTALAERVRQSFDGKLGDDGKSNENLDEKIKHARTIRQWLGQWNLALRNPNNGEAVQIFGEQSPAINGTFRLYPLASKEGSKRTSKWSIVRETLCSPTLVDVTKVIHRRDHLRSR